MFPFQQPYDFLAIRLSAYFAIILYRMFIFFVACQLRVKCMLHLIEKKLHFEQN